MSEPFIAEIRIFGGTYAPRNWAFCDGGVMPIQENPSLFALIGTTYGGDGRTTMGLPDMRGRAPLHAGSAPGLTSYPLGSFGGHEGISLTEQQIPPHTHVAAGTTTGASQSGPKNAFAAAGQGRGKLFYGPDDPTGSFEKLADTGEGYPHENRQPYVVMNFIIALQGVFPNRN